MPHTAASDPDVLATLKARVRALERGGAQARSAPVLPTGYRVLDDHLPGGGLDGAALHALHGGAPALAFLAGLVTRALDQHAGPVLWAAPEGRARGLYGPGLARLGLPTERALVVAGRDNTDVLWALEEGLNSGAVAAVAGEPKSADRVAARRLQLAAEKAGRPAFLLGTDGDAPATARTRWRVEAAPEGAWRVHLERCRDGRPATWTLEAAREQAPAPVASADVPLRRAG